MKIRVRGSKINRLISRLCERRLGFALDRFTGRIRNADVILNDLNGPKGGRDKECRITLRLIPKGLVVVKAVRENFATALDKTLERAERALSRRIERQRWKRISFSSPE